MAKRFSIVTVNNEDIFLKGYAMPKDLSNSKIFLEVLSEISSYQKVEVEINHCLFLDFPDDDVDISVEDLEFVVENVDYFIENQNIFSEEIITFEMNGLMDDEIVEENV